MSLANGCIVKYGLIFYRLNVALFCPPILCFFYTSKFVSRKYFPLRLSPMNLRFIEVIGIGSKAPSVQQRFIIFILWPHYLRGKIALMMEAVSTPEMSVSNDQATQRNIAQDSYLLTCRRENSKSHHANRCPLCCDMVLQEVSNVSEEHNASIFKAEVIHLLSIGILYS